MIRKDPAGCADGKLSLHLRQAPAMPLSVAHNPPAACQESVPLMARRPTPNLRIEPEERSALSPFVTIVRRRLEEHLMPSQPGCPAALVAPV